ncbi:MAG: hypothetical protein U5R48_01980 [Gammaproteobacteria bacterium]|nr:hypothetical protein [Gammaproteobacteria bacterium]
MLEYALPECEPGRLSPWTADIENGPAVPDRWRIVQALGYEEQIRDPYAAHNPIKGDLPVWGEDWFFNITAISDTIVEPRRFPLPVGIATTARPGSLDLIGRGESTVFVETFLPEFVIYKGNTTFKPPDWEFRFTPAINYNQAHFDERGIAKVEPGGADISGRVRKEGHIGIQSLFIDKHLRNVSDRYDFDSLRVGIQPITADFRGFLFLDQQLGIRLFGTRDNNIFQYNLAAFQRMEKDLNTALNNHGEDLRDDWVFLANLYWQDMPVKGHIAQVTVVHNRNRERGQIKFDDNGFIARPSSLFEERFSRDYDVTYLGFNGDGHFGRLEPDQQSLLGRRRADQRPFPRCRGRDQRPVRGVRAVPGPGLDALAAVGPLGQRRRGSVRRRGDGLRRHLRESPVRRRRHQFLDPPAGSPDRRRDRPGLGSQRRAQLAALEQGDGPVQLRQPRAPG